ncbi:MAG: NlpC/P60 family protein [Clostridiales bacterium]|nr:NlpC/P60 family protein [Clostridiales bacterium]
MGNPYVWGGNSLTNGCDCSGFVHQVLAHFGISSPRYSGSFASWGKAVSVSDMQVGDVVVYSGHVGFYAGNGLLLSALGADYGITYCSVYYKSIVAVRRAW